MQITLQTYDLRNVFYPIRCQVLLKKIELYFEII